MGFWGFGVRHHSVEELLDAGVSAWFYRKEREDDCRAIIDWLYKNNYIAIGEVVDEEEENFFKTGLL